MLVGQSANPLLVLKASHDFDQFIRVKDPGGEELVGSVFFHPLLLTRRGALIFNDLSG